MNSWILNLGTYLNLPDLVVVTITDVTMEKYVNLRLGEML